jgi:hypothetical protein
VPVPKTRLNNIADPRTRGCVVGDNSARM